jgi:hypothetical protein
VGTIRDEEVASRTGHSVKAVRHRRLALGLPPFEPTHRPWTPEEDAMLGTDSDKNIAHRLGRHPGLVSRRRAELGIPRKRDTLRQPRTRPWAAEELSVLGTAPDADVGSKLGRSLNSVNEQRRKLGLRSKNHPQAGGWTPAEEVALGKDADAKVAVNLGRTVKSVGNRRRQLKIPAFNPNLQYWNAEAEDLLGTMPDEKVAARLGCSTDAVRRRRRALGIANATRKQLWCYRVPCPAVVRCSAESRAGPGRHPPEVRFRCIGPRQCMPVLLF